MLNISSPNFAKHDAQPPGPIAGITRPGSIPRARSDFRWGATMTMPSIQEVQKKAWFADAFGSAEGQPRAYIVVESLRALKDVLPELPGQWPSGTVIIIWQPTGSADASQLDEIRAPGARMDADWSEPHGSLQLDPCIARAMHFIRRNFRNSLRLGQVSALARLSPCHFSRLFKRQVGMSYTYYLASLRIESAQSLLGTTARSVTEICYEVGFNDLSHFERTFRRFTGISPSRYRQHTAVPALAATT